MSEDHAPATEHIGRLAAALGRPLPQGPAEYAWRDLIANVERLRDVLMDCWTEFREIAPDPMYDAMREVLVIHEGTATLDKRDSDGPEVQP